MQKEALIGVQKCSIENVWPGFELAYVKYFWIMTINMQEGFKRKNLKWSAYGQSLFLDF